MATNDTVAYSKPKIKGIGPSLATFVGKDLVLRNYTVDRERPFGDGTSVFVAMTVSPVSGPDKDTEISCHAWSPNIADELESLEREGIEVPFIISPRKTTTRNHREVLTLQEE